MVTRVRGIGKEDIESRDEAITEDRIEVDIVILHRREAQTTEVGLDAPRAIIRIVYLQLRREKVRESSECHFINGESARNGKAKGELDDDPTG